MALNGLILDQRNNTSKNWRNILAEIMEDGIFRDGCEITFTSNSITVGGGYFIQRGTVIENDGAETIPVMPTLTDGYVRLICRVDLTKEATETGPGQVEWATDFSATSTFPALVQEDILSTGSVYEIEVVVLQIVSGNITGITRQIGNAEIDAAKLGGKREDELSVAIAALAQNALQLNGHPSTYYGIATNEFKAMGTLSGNINFDTISTSGAQKWQMAGVTNVPAGVDGYGILFSFMQGGYTVQKIIDTAGRETSRFYQGSSWTQWQSYMKYIRMLSGNDTLVNYSENGMYMLAGVTNSGIPGFGGYGMLRVESYRPTSGNPYVKQVVCDTANRKWERVFNQASWTAWKQTIAA